MHRAANTGEPASASECDRIVTLDFDWRACRFSAALDRESVHESRLKITCDLGPLPFSAEGVQRRINMFAVLDATRSNPEFRTTVSRKQQIGMIAEMKLASPVTTTTFLSGIVALLCQARPYLDIVTLLQQQPQPRKSVRLRQ